MASMPESTWKSSKADPLVQLETRLIGAVLTRPDLADLVVSETGLSGDDFSDATHALVFSAIQEDLERGIPVDAVLLAEKLRSKVDIPGLVGPASQETPSVEASLEYARKIRRHSIIRQFKSAAARLIQHPDSDLAVAEVQRHLDQLLIATGGGPRSIGEFAAQVIENLSNPRPGLSYGFKDLDDLTGGMKPGEMIILAGRPGMGKSSLANQIAVNTSLSGRIVLLFSLEVSGVQVASKIIALLAGIPLQDIRQGRVSPLELLEHMARLENVPLVIDDRGGLTTAAVRGASLRQNERRGLDLVIVDYLQLLHGDGKYPKRYEEITAISGAIKQIARELEVPVIALSQLSRDVENRADKRPVLADLRDSGALEQDADVVILLYREKYYDAGSDDTAEIIIAKQRHGPTGTVKVVFDPAVAVFKER